MWQRELALTLRALGFTASRLLPGVFWHKERDLTVVFHVDDLLLGGPDEQLDWFREQLAKKYDIAGNKITENDNALRFLGRVIALTTEGYEWRGDPRHAETLALEWGMAHANSVNTPATQPEDPKREIPCRPWVRMKLLSFVELLF